MIFVRTHRLLIHLWMVGTGSLHLHVMSLGQNLLCSFPHYLRVCVVVLSTFTL